jgi:hypothetical protein
MFALDATVDTAGHATGTLADHQVVAVDAAMLTCDSGQVSWNALRQ